MTFWDILLRVLGVIWLMGWFVFANYVVNSRAIIEHEMFMKGLVDDDDKKLSMRWLCQMTGTFIICLIVGPFWFFLVIGSLIFIFYGSSSQKGIYGANEVLGVQQPGRCSIRFRTALFLLQYRYIGVSF